MIYETEMEYDEQCVLEAVFAKKAIDQMLSSYLKQIEPRLKTVEDCDELISKIKSESGKFNDNLKIIQRYKVEYDNGSINRAEYKRYSKEAANNIASSCRVFKINISKFGGSSVDDITKEDIVNFKAYLAGIVKGVNTIKNEKIRNQKYNKQINISKATESGYDNSNLYEKYKQEFNQAISDLEKLI